MTDCHHTTIPRLITPGVMSRELGTVSTLETLVTFYVDEHNTQLPHSAFRGQTPDEMYFGTGNDIPAELEAARITARTSRIETNRNMSCKTCEPLTSIAG